jgi:hypothetical protein
MGLALSVALLVYPGPGLRVRASGQELTVTANFTSKESVTPKEPIELYLSRVLAPAEGRLAVLIGQTDLTRLLVTTETRLSYAPGLVPLPAGETQVIVYLVSPADEWKEIARLPLRVATAGGAPPAAPPEQTSPAASQPQPPEAEANKAKKYQLLPSLTLGFKSQAAESHFPATNRPERPTYGDFTLQGSLRTELERGGFNSQTQFDLVGSSYQKEALRFGERGNAAPQLDLSSYLLQFQMGKAKLTAGHISYGSSRHLINSYGSRGLSLWFPLGRRQDISLAAMNGTSIVGWSNFFGLDRRRHQIVSGTWGLELLPERPRGLRLEAGMLHGSLLPLSGYNQGHINDAERSRGLSLRLIASDKTQRLRLDGGWARSRFTNPRDILLDQGAQVVAVRETTRNARYLDLSYDLLRNWKLSPTKAANLTVNYRHEQADPLYRSVAAFTPADRMQNQLELAGSIGEVQVTFSELRFNNNLENIPSILKAFTRREYLMVGAPLGSILGHLFNRGPAASASAPPQPSPWLPRLSYNFDRTHQFGQGLPSNSGFDSLSQVPDQVSTPPEFFDGAPHLLRQLEPGAGSGEHQSELQR